MSEEGLDLDDRDYDEMAISAISHKMLVEMYIDLREKVRWVKNHHPSVIEAWVLEHHDILGMF